MSDNFATGILPFDSDDPSILLRSTLKSAAAITSPLVGSAGTIVGSGHEFDSIRGFRNPATGTAGVTWTALTGYQALDNAGQISFEIEREAACSKSTVYGSTGDNPPNDYSGQALAWILVWTADGGTTYGNMRKSQGDANGLSVQFKNAGETNGFVSLHTQNKGDFVRITLSWIGSKTTLFVDNKPVAYSTAPTRGVAWANQFATLWLMHFNGGNGVRRRFMRNIIVSTKPVFLPKLPGNRLAMMGHSFSMNYADSNGSSAYDETMNQIIRGRLVARGCDVEFTSDGAGGGYVISALTTAPFQLRSATFLDSLKARQATEILLLQGTNDVGNAGFTPAAFDTDYKAQLTTIAAGHSGKFTQRIFVTTVPSRNAETGTWSQLIADNTVLGNAVINALPAWWNSNFPARAGQLIVLPLFDVWGGMYPVDPVQSGQLAGATPNLHPSPFGALRIADMFQRAVGL